MMNPNKSKFVTYIDDVFNLEMLCVEGSDVIRILENSVVESNNHQPSFQLISTGYSFEEEFFASTSLPSGLELTLSVIAKSHKKQGIKNEQHVATSHVNVGTKKTTRT
jgi:hypothetical protein